MKAFLEPVFTQHVATKKKPYLKAFLLSKLAIIWGQGCRSLS